MKIFSITAVCLVPDDFDGKLIEALQVMIDHGKKKDLNQPAAITVDDLEIDKEALSEVLSKLANRCLHKRQEDPDFKTCILWGFDDVKQIGKENASNI